MSRQWLRHVVSLGVVALAVSCARLPEREQEEARRWGTPGTLPVEALDDSLSIPSDWGEVIGVTALGEEERAATRLWLQDEEGTIRLVTYDHAKSVLWPLAPVIRRR